MTHPSAVTDGGRVVLITGASSGIGRAVARELAGRGDSIALLARRRTELEQVASECRELGSPEVVVLPTDVSEAQAVETAFVSARQELGPIENVIHAAGVAAYGHFEDIPAGDFRRVLDVNVAGTANVARSALRLFEREQLVGNLILFGSLVGRISTPGMSPYVASKWAVRGLVRTIQAEQSPSGHRVSLVEPGGVDTSIYEKAATYLGFQGKPPPPVDTVEKVARATVALLERPRRARSVGPLNPLISLGFRVAPPVYDRIVGPLMNKLAIDDRPVTNHPGNLFQPLAEPTGQTNDDRGGDMGEPRGTITRTVDASPEAVWEVLADGWLYPSWVVGAARMRDVDENWPDVGSRLHHSVGNWPFMLDDRTEVLESVPRKVLRLKAHGWPAGAAEVTIEIEQDGAKSRIHIREDAVEGPGTLVPRPLRQAAIKPRNTEALRRLGFLAEGRAGNAS